MTKLFFLIASDHAALRTSLRTQLEKWEEKALEAFTWEDAVRKCRERAFDFVIAEAHGLCTSPTARFRRQFKLLSSLTAVFRFLKGALCRR